MNLDTFAWLRSSAGQMLLNELAQQELTAAGVLPVLTRLRAAYPAERARAAVEQTLLRQRARAKFSRAEVLYFTRESLEQASSEAVAAHRARRFAAYAYVADICCGIGGDALALAASGRHVTAVDRDQVRLALATANAAALELSARITFVCRDIVEQLPPRADALFCDPGRRTDGRRRFHVDQYDPPLAHVLTWRARTPALAVKLAPGVDVTELAAVRDYELEFVSLDGELKEATLWCGPLATTRRRATVLRNKTQDAGQAAANVAISYESATLTENPTGCAAALAPPDHVLYEPDPAVIRAGLVAELAAQIGAAQIDPDIAYLTAPTVITTPFARSWRVLEWLPFSLKRLRARLRALDAGTVTVKKRGSPLDPNTLARQLSGTGTRALVVVLTHVAGRPAALICEKA